MAGTEAIVVPILIDPKAGVAGLKAFGTAAVETGAKFTAANTGSKLFGDGVKNLGKSFLAFNPLVGIGIAAVSSFITSIIGANDEVSQFAESQKKLAGYQKQVAEELGKEVAQVSKLKAVIESEVTSRKQKELAIQSLRKINPEYFGDLKFEEGLINKLNTAYGAYIKNIVGRAEINVLGKQLEDISTTIIDLERKGATSNVFVPQLTRDNEGRLQIARALTKEQIEQNRLNLPYSEALRVRDGLLAQILLKQQGITDAIVAPDVKAGKATKLPVYTDLSGLSDTIIFPPEEAEIQGFTFAQMFYKGLNEYFNQTEPIDFSLINADKAYEEARKQAELLLQQNIRLADQISGVLTPLTDTFIDALTSRQDAIKAFFQSIGNAVKQLIKQLIAAVVQAAILSLITGGAAGGGFSFKGAFKKVLGFASGGLVTGPVSALVGEGVGTNRSNPEVVAPLDKLKSFFNNMTNGRGGMMNSAKMGISGSILNMPAFVEIRASGRNLVGVMNLENASQRRTS